MAYQGDKWEHCHRCARQTKHVMCPRCRGSSRAGTPERCSHCGSTGRKCVNGVNDRSHR